MAGTTHHTLKDSDKIKSILNGLGYELMDFGSCWRTKALYRDGDNPAAIQIYKNTGVWIDFADGAQGLPFELLVQRTLGGDRKKCKEVLNSLGKKNTEFFAKPSSKELITMDKVYPEECLNNLFPNYHFYNQKGISDEVQKRFKLGLAPDNSLKMYRRLTFPIYDRDGKIVGFSGRTLDPNNMIKWKHVGKKTKWVYPAFVPTDTTRYTVDEIIDLRGQVYLVESIGDCMAMCEADACETLITFGLNISPALLSYLSSKDLRRIIIVPNNDIGSKKNNGVIGGIKNFIKLSKYFDLDQLVIKTPPDQKNDVGDALVAGCDLKTWKNEVPEDMLDGILSFIEKNIHSFKREEDSIKKLRREINARKT